LYLDGEYGMASISTVNSVLRQDYGDIVWDNKYFRILALLSQGMSRQPDLFSACLGVPYVHGGYRETNILRNRINMLRKYGYLQTDLRPDKGVRVNFHFLTPKGKAVVNRLKGFVHSNN